MDDEAAEQLRRRLYEQGATEEDLARFREAEASERPAVATATDLRPVGPRRRRPLAVGVVLVAASVIAVALQLLRPPAAPDEWTISASRTPAPTSTVLVALPLTAVDPGDVDRDVAVADLFRAGPIAGSRADDFSALTALRVAPRTADIDLERSGSGSDRGEPLIESALPDVVLEPGDLLVVTAITDRPATTTWRFLAARGDRARARTAVLARSPHAVVVGGAVRIRHRTVLDGLAIEVDDGARLRYRYAIHRYREPLPFDHDVSQVDLRCAFDRADAEVRCARRG